MFRQNSYLDLYAITNLIAPIKLENIRLAMTEHAILFKPKYLQVNHDFLTEIKIICYKYHTDSYSPILFVNFKDIDTCCMIEDKQCVSYRYDIDRIETKLLDIDMFQ